MGMDNDELAALVAGLGVAIGDVTSEWERKKERIETLVDMYIDLGCKYIGVERSEMPPVKIGYSMTHGEWIGEFGMRHDGTLAGRWGEINFNRRYVERYFELICDEVVPHEVAHMTEREHQIAVFGTILPDRVQGHTASWRRIMKFFGIDKPERHWLHGDA